MNTISELIIHLKKSKVLFTFPIENALLNADRKDFVPQKYSKVAYRDEPLPIGYGQTISQPTTVVFMLELLKVSLGDNVLDVGTGSGWTTALLASLTGSKGKVVGTERIKELVEYGKTNLEKYSLKNASIIKSGETLGYPLKAPYDRILVSAFATEIPYELEKQLNIGGILVIPIGNSIVKAVKPAPGKLDISTYYGFSFVPLIT